MNMMGHVLIGDDGAFVSVDAGFCGMMQTEAEAMIGRLVLDVTAVPDRAECALAIQTLRDTLHPFTLSKRLVRDDGSMLWVTNRVSITDWGGGPRTIVATLTRIADPDQYRSPARLLECARLLFASGIDRSLAFDRTLFSDPAWDMLLAAYIAEAEGDLVDCASVARATDVTRWMARGWLRVLIDKGLIEMEITRADDSATGPFRLTATGHALFEDHLAGLAVKHRDALTVS